MTIATAVKSDQGYSCDLRDWLKEVKRLEQLEQISGAHWDLEIGALTEIILGRISTPPALVFDNVPGFDPGRRFEDGRLHGCGHGQAGRDEFRFAGFKGIQPHAVETQPVFPQRVIAASRHRGQDRAPRAGVAEGPIGKREALAIADTLAEPLPSLEASALPLPRYILMTTLPKCCADFRYL